MILYVINVNILIMDPSVRTFMFDSFQCINYVILDFLINMDTIITETVMS